MPTRPPFPGRTALVAALLLCATAAQAAVVVAAAWVRPTPDRAATDAYLTLTSSDDAALKEARSVLATSVVIRGATGPKTLPQVALPAGTPVVLAADGVHLVLRGLAHPLAPGDRVPLVLTIESASGARAEIVVNAEVRARAPGR